MGWELGKHQPHLPAHSPPPKKTFPPWRSASQAGSRSNFMWWPLPAACSQKDIPMAGLADPCTCPALYLCWNQAEMNGSLKQPQKTPLDTKVLWSVINGPNLPFHYSSRFIPCVKCWEQHRGVWPINYRYLSKPREESSGRSSTVGHGWAQLTPSTTALPCTMQRQLDIWEPTETAGKCLVNSWNGRQSAKLLALR